MLKKSNGKSRNQQFLKVKNYRHHQQKINHLHNQDQGNYQCLAFDQQK
jgi:hypothetical protein